MLMAILVLLEKIFFFAHKTPIWFVYVRLVLFSRALRSQKPMCILYLLIRSILFMCLSVCLSLTFYVCGYERVCTCLSVCVFQEGSGYLWSLSLSLSLSLFLSPSFSFQIVNVFMLAGKKITYCKKH